MFQILCYLYLIPSIYSVVPGTIDGLSEQQVSDQYDSIDAYQPRGWELLGSLFLNSTRNNAPIQQSDLLIDPQAGFSVDNINTNQLQTKYTGVAAFLIITVLSALIFCLLAPILACCCGCCKSRRTFSTNHGKLYEQGAYTLILLSFILFVTISVLTGISGGALNNSAVTIASSVGSVYNGGLIFAYTTETTLASILNDMSTFAKDKVDYFTELVIVETLNATQTNLTNLSNDLNEQFTYSDDFIGNLSYRIVNIDSMLSQITIEYDIESNEYNWIQNNLTDLGANQQTVLPQSYLYTSSVNPFPQPASFKQSSGLDPSSFPTNLTGSAQQLNSSKGAFGKEANAVVVNMISQISLIKGNLNSTFENYRNEITNGESTLSTSLESGYNTSIQMALPYGSELSSNLAYKKYAVYVFWLVLGIVILTFLLFIGILFCIASKKRKLAMSCASLLFVFAAVSLLFSSILFIIAFGVTEVCDQLNDNFPIAQGMVPSSYTAAGSAFIKVIDQCANNNPIDQIVESPEIKPYIEKIYPNFTNYLNISSVYDTFMASNLNTSTFVNGLDFELSDVANFTDITQAVNDLYAQDLSSVDIQSIMPYNGINMTVISQIGNGIRSISSSLNNTSAYIYQNAGANANRQTCVNDYLFKVNTQASNSDYIQQQVNNTNMLIKLAAQTSNQTVADAAQLKTIMLAIPVFISNSFDIFQNTTAEGRLFILNKVNEMPDEIKSLLNEKFNLLKSKVTCTAMGQTMKVMEFEFCSVMRNSLNGMWFSFWILGYSIIITFIALDLGANILFRTKVGGDGLRGEAYDSQDLIKLKPIIKATKVSKNTSVATKIQATAIMDDEEEVKINLGTSVSLPPGLNQRRNSNLPTNAGFKIGNRVTTMEPKLENKSESEDEQQSSVRESFHSSKDVSIASRLKSQKLVSNESFKLANRKTNVAPKSKSNSVASSISSVASSASDKSKKLK